MSFNHATAYVTHIQKKIAASCAGLINWAIIKNFLIYSCGSIMLRGIAIFMAPITLNILNPANYGLLSLITSFNNIFVACIGLGLRQVFYLEYFHCNEFERKSMTNTIAFIFVVVALPVIALFMCNASMVNALVFDDNATVMLIFFVLCVQFHFFLC